MIFLLLLVVFSFFLHKFSVERGLSPWRYVGGFVAGFFLILFATSAVIVAVYGQTIINDPDVQEKVMLFAPFAMLFHFLLFVFFRMKITKARMTNKDDDEPTLPDNGTKKDLSYFR